MSRNNTGGYSDKELDRLLAQEAVLRDDGFSETLTARLQQEKPLSDSHREPRLFGVFAGVWLVLAIVAGVPGQLLEWIAAYRHWFTSLAQSELTSGLQLSAFLSQTTPLLALAVLAGVALLAATVLAD